MAQPFLSEIRVVSFGILPRGWAYCNGQLLSIAQNQALFALLGTTYGGDGVTTFALPNLQGRIPMHTDNSTYYLGESSGQTSHTLLISEMPSHTHAVLATTAPATASNPEGQAFATASTTVGTAYGPGIQQTTMSEQMVGRAGGSQPHMNMMPILSLNFMIAIQGIFPSRS